MYEKTFGAKYDASLTRTQIASAIRQDLKAAQKAGQLPVGCRFSVRKAPRGRSIDLTVIAVPAGFQIQNPEVITGQAQPFHLPHGRFSVEGGELLDKLKEIHGAYNYDGSDIQTDYFDVNYYGSADFASSLLQAERERVEQLAAKPARTVEPQVEFLTWAGVQ